MIRNLVFRCYDQFFEMFRPEPLFHLLMSDMLQLVAVVGTLNMRVQETGLDVLSLAGVDKLRLLGTIHEVTRNHSNSWVLLFAD